MKKKPSIAEAGNFQTDTEYRGKKYTMKVEDKVSDVDGISESHISYDPQWRPKGAKSRGNFATGADKCFSWCKCVQCRKKKLKRKKR